ERRRAMTTPADEPGNLTGPRKNGRNGLVPEAGMVGPADGGADGEDTAADLFAALPEADAKAHRRLHARLTGAAQREGLLDVAYRTLETPVGSLLLAATEQGLVRVAYDVQDHAAVLADLAERVSPRVLQAPERLAEA